MLFFYSRKIQFILLLCWSAGIVGMYSAIIDSDAHIFNSANSSQSATVKPSIAQLPAMNTASQFVAAKKNADPRRNRAEALRIATQTIGNVTTLVLEFDYLPAETDGFVPAKTRDYYIDHPPTFVLSLGEHWITDIEKKTYPVNLPQVSGVTPILSQSNHLRLLVHTRTSAQAMNAKAQIIPTATGLQAKIYLLQ